MGDLIKVNTSRLKDDVAEIKGYLKSIETGIADLKGHNAALDAMWDGPSSEAFKTAFAEDIAALEQIVKSITSLNEYEDNAREKYDKCEQKVADLVNQIKVR